MAPDFFRYNTATLGFAGAAFISYAPLDDIALDEGGEGWITTLARALEARLAQLTGSESNVWWDPKPEGRDCLEPTLAERLPRVAVFVAVVSPRYVKSEWARRELATFCEAAAGQGSVRVHDKARIFKVLKTPVPLEQQPAELRSILGYEFFKLDPATGKVRGFDEIFGPEAKQDFWLKLDDLARDIADHITVQPAVVSSSPSQSSVLLSHPQVYRLVAADVFTSDTKFDNTALPNAHQGWVAGLRRALETRLAQLLSQAPGIWWDPKRLGNDLAKALMARVERAAVFVLVTPRRIGSDAQRKVTAFFEAAQAFMSRLFHRIWHGSEDSVAELYLVPVVMGALSLTIWFSMPTLPEVLAPLANRIKVRYQATARFAAQAARPSWGIDGCAATFDPPIRIHDNRAGNLEPRNTEVLDGWDLSRLAIDNTLAQDLPLTLAGSLRDALSYHESGPYGLTKSRTKIDAEFERPLAYRYLIIYGTRFTEPLLARRPDGSAGGAVNVGVQIFDFETNSQICQLAFRETLRAGFEASRGEPQAREVLSDQVRERLSSTLAGLSASPAR